MLDYCTIDGIKTWICEGRPFSHVPIFLQVLEYTIQKYIDPLTPHLGVAQINFVLRVVFIV